MLPLIGLPGPCGVCMYVFMFSCTAHALCCGCAEICEHAYVWYHTPCTCPTLRPAWLFVLCVDTGFALSKRMQSSAVCMQGGQLVWTCEGPRNMTVCEALPTCVVPRTAHAGFVWRSFVCWVLDLQQTPKVHTSTALCERVHAAVCVHCAVHMHA